MPWKCKKPEASFSVGSKIKTMELSPSQTFISVGGQEHDLELFNIEDHKSYFKGKNLPHDKLDMRIPICLNCQTVFYDYYLVFIK